MITTGCGAAGSHTKLSQGRVLIMTQPLTQNYGCIVQAYALQRVLKQLGLDPVTNDPVRFRNPLRRFLGQVRSVLEDRIDSRETRVIAAELRRFVTENIETIDLFNGQSAPTSAVLRSFSAFVVGSDQVWRAAYSDIPRHLLSFVPARATKISYAASFGTADLAGYTPELIVEASRLARRFDAISVREESGVEICRELWGVAAEQHVDPTLLLTKDDWVSVVKRDRVDVSPSPGSLLAYVLDKNLESRAILGAVAELSGLAPFSPLPDTTNSRREYRRDPDKYRMMAVTQWLQGFADAEFVVVDSFHGCVFSIIFNKPFIVIGNRTRGLARFTSLLHLFDLEDRLISSVDEVTPSLVAEDIDWAPVNAIIDAQRAKSLDFLRQHLLTSS